MPYAFLNHLSFPARDIDTALESLSALRAGVARLVSDRLSPLPFY